MLSNLLGSGDIHTFEASTSTLTLDSGLEVVIPTGNLALEDALNVVREVAVSRGLIGKDDDVVSFAV